MPDGDAHLTPDQAFHFAAELAAGGRDEAGLRWFQRGLAAWLRSGCAVSLQRCMLLPGTPTQLRRMQRDYWLLVAAREIEAEGPCQGAMKLEEELKTFVSRGPWRLWCSQAEPPADASRLRAALFRVAKLNDSKPLKYRQIQNIVGNVWRR